MLNILDDTLIPGWEARLPPMAISSVSGCAPQPRFASAFLLSLSGYQMLLGAWSPAAQEHDGQWTH